MEHVIGDEFLERLISFTEFIQACPRCGKDWITSLEKENIKFNCTNHSS